MENVQVKNVSLHGFASFPLLNTTEQSLNSFSYNFSYGKTYCLDSILTGWGWGLSWLIAGKMQPQSGTIKIKGENVNSHTLKQHTMPVGLSLDGLISSRSTVRKQLMKGLKKNNQLFNSNLNDCLDYFGLEISRLDRNIEQISAMRYKASIAIGYVNCRDIFCFPWMNHNDVSDNFCNWLPDILLKLKKLNCIVIIPTQFNSKMGNLFDEVVKFKD